MWSLLESAIEFLDPETGAAVENVLIGAVDPEIC
jgi:hypothetical protein